MLLKHIPLCCFLTHVIYAGNYHMSCFKNREHIMFCLETLDLSDEPELLVKRIQCTNRLFWPEILKFRYSLLQDLTFEIFTKCLFRNY